MKKSRVIPFAALFLSGMSLFCASVFCRAAGASLIVIEPDTFSVGTDVSNIVPGVTISRFTRDSDASPTISPVYVTDNHQGYPPATGTRSFGQFGGVDYDMPEEWLRWKAASPPLTGPSFDPGSDSYSAMVVQLDNPTNYFEIACSWLSDNIHLYAYDASDALVARYEDQGSLRNLNATGSFDLLSYGGPWVGTIQVGQTGAGLDPFFQTIIIGSWSASEGTSLDRIRVAVPEPSAMAVLGMGLAGVVGFGRKRMKT